MLTNLENLKNSVLIDLLAEQTKKFTRLLYAGIQDHELDTSSDAIHRLITEIKLRRSKTDLTDHPEIKAADVYFPGDGT